jgi:hypothetical protein
MTAKCGESNSAATQLQVVKALLTYVTGGWPLEGGGREGGAAAAGRGRAGKGRAGWQRASIPRRARRRAQHNVGQRGDSAFPAPSHRAPSPAKAVLSRAPPHPPPAPALSTPQRSTFWRTETC